MYRITFISGHDCCIIIIIWNKQERKTEKNELNTGIEDKHLLPFIIVVVLSFGATP